MEFQKVGCEIAVKYKALCSIDPTKNGRVCLSIEVQVKVGIQAWGLREYIIDMN